MSQLSYDNQAVAFEGMLADNAPRDVKSGLLEGATHRFGLAVSKGTADGTVKSPAPAEAIAGVLFHQHAQEGDALVAGDVENVLTKGRMHVKVEDAVVEGGLVYVRTAAGELGAFRSDVDAGNAELLPGAKYGSSAGAGELAILDLNLPA